MNTGLIERGLVRMMRRTAYGAWRTGVCIAPARTLMVALALALALTLAPRAAMAQVRDSTRKDTVRIAVPIPAPAKPDSDATAREVARADSIAKFIAGDTIKAPLARFEMPADGEITPRLRFTRSQILSSGAMNLADLLDRVPGVTTFRSGWLAGLHVAAYQGDARRIRYFVDGVELDAIEARNDGVLDLTDVQLWTLDELVIERAAGEIRVWMRTSTVTRTTPYTRVDIFTGDLNTNAFRGLLARRWRNGLSLQAGGQQVATQTGRVSAFSTAGTQRSRSDGAVQAFMTRIGWARGKVSADAFATMVSRDRDAHTPRKDFDSLPSFKGVRREGYVRVGYGDTLRGFWSQALVGALRTTLGHESSTTSNSSVADTNPVTDTTRARTQQLVAVGYRTDWWSVSLTDRMRLGDGERHHAPAARASVRWRMLDAGAWLERTGPDSTDRTDLFVRARPLSWLAVTASHTSRTPDDSTFRVASNATRLEAAVRFRELWLGGGVIRDGITAYNNLTLIGAPSALLSAEAAQGFLVSGMGRLYKDVYVDVQAIRWDGGQYSRPRMHVRTELALMSDWRRKFPKGEFSINARLMYDMRDQVPFYYLKGGETDTRISERAQVATGLLELRIQRATLFYQYRNLTGGQYEQIRGITMPTALQTYGVRWEFWN